MVQSVVIVGAGQAGAQAAESLRRGGFDGQVTMIGLEPVGPYQRPPLSKAYLSGEAGMDRLEIKPADAWQDLQIDLKLSTSVEALDVAGKSVRLSDATRMSFDIAILATGSRPRRLRCPGADLPGVFELRTFADADSLRAVLQPGARLAIIGAGYIGLEVAAIARKLGVDVDVVEAAARPLARVAGQDIASFLQARHEAAGVRFHCQAQLTAMTGTDRVEGVQLAGGMHIPCDAVLVGIGALPNQELALEAGLAVDDGILVDEDARTSALDIFAIGDCTRRPLASLGRTHRLESVHNALEQAKLAAAAILGQPRPALEAPWFWSDQYQYKLQIAGISIGHDRAVLRASGDGNALSVFYFKGAKMLAADCINAAPEFLTTRRALIQGLSFDPDLLADPALPMKEIAAKAV